MTEFQNDQNRTAIQGIATRFQDTNLNAVGVLTISFDELVLKLRREDVISAADGYIKLLHTLSSEGTENDSYKIRVFLASYMISYRPVFCFESMGRIEQKVFESGKILTAYIEAITPRLASDESISEIPLKDFIPLMDQYMTDFQVWKVPDEQKIIDRIKGALSALYGAYSGLPDDEPTDSDLRTEINVQIERLRGKFVQIRNAGELALFDEVLASERLFNAIALDDLID